MSGCDDEPTAPTPPPSPTSIVINPDTIRFSSLDVEFVASATVLDQSGQPMSGVSVEWSASDSSVVSVGSDGRVRSLTNGRATVFATTSGVEGRAQVEVRQVATRVQVIDQPRVALVGGPIAPVVRVEVQDANGWLVEDADVVVSVRLTGPPGVSLQGDTAVAAERGVARFDGLAVLGSTAGGLGLTVVADGLEEGSSENFDLVVREFAYSSTRLGVSNLYVGSSDGVVDRTVATSAFVDGQPAWSPDGQRLAFHSRREGQGDIWVVNADGSGLRNLTADPGAFQIQPAWSPDGSKIAFMNRTGGDKVYVIDANGGEPVLLFGGDGLRGGWPAWSPDGERLCISAQDGPADLDLWVIDADGSNARSVAEDPAFEIGCAWFPDGERIAFNSRRSGSFDIYSVRADGSGLVELTNDPGEDILGDVSPDGHWLIFNSDRTGDVDLYFATADGGSVMHVGDRLGTDEAATWRPLF